MDSKIILFQFWFDGLGNINAEYHIFGIFMESQNKVQSDMIIFNVL